MDNQHRKIKGYRELNQAEIDLMNDIKAHGELTRELVQRVADQAADDSAESAEWVQRARAKLQQGVMCLTRAVAKPEFF